MDKIKKIEIIIFFYTLRKITVGGFVNQLIKTFWPKADAREVRSVALSISFHEQTQKPSQQIFSHVCVELILSN